MGILATLGAAGGALLNSGFLGNILGAKVSKDNNRDNIKAQNVINQQNYDVSKEFAQNSIKWKAKDAREAGFHPLASLGQQASYAPTAMSSGYGQSDDAGYVANIVNSLGQVAANLSEALNKDSTRELAGQIDRTDDQPKVKNTTIEKVDIPANLTNRTIRQVDKKGSGYDSKSTKGAYGLNENPNGNGVTLVPAEGTVEAERRSEGSAFDKVTALFSDERAAIETAIGRDAAMRKEKPGYEPDNRAVWSWSKWAYEILDFNNPKERAYASVVQTTADSIDKGISKGVHFLGGKKRYDYKH